MDIAELIAKAGLPAAVDCERLTGGRGMDNTLTLIRLTDGRRLLARQPVGPFIDDDQSSRVAFLERNHVGAPKVYATDIDGSSLVEWIPGVTLANYLARHGVSSTLRVWRWLGSCMAAIHRVRFPAPLQGKVGPTSIVLHPRDPVDALLQEVDRSRAWITTHHAALIDVLERLISEYAEQIRAEQPCLLHNDTTFDNFIVTDDAVRPIDWDLPAVGYPLAELGNLDQQAYLYGSADGLPAEFWRGYGSTYPRRVLLVYRAVRCISLLAGPHWATWDADPAVDESMKAELRRRHGLHRKWVTTLPTLLLHTCHGERHD